MVFVTCKNCNVTSSKKWYNVATKWLRKLQTTYDWVSFSVVSSSCNCIHHQLPSEDKKVLSEMKVLLRPIVNLWHKDTSWSKYAMPQGEVNSDWSIYALWGMFYTSWGINRPIRTYLTLRHGIFTSWGMFMPQVNNGPYIKLIFTFLF